jgi:hypothetical protein
LILRGYLEHRKMSRLRQLSLSQKKNEEEFFLQQNAI